MIAALILLCLDAAPAIAQFAPPSRPVPSRAGVSMTTTSRPNQAGTLAQQQEWVRKATRDALRKIDFLPRVSAVPAVVEQSITAYAPENSFGTGYATSVVADGCQQSIRAAEKHYNLPPYLLAAIALTESGRNGRPSPLAMNIKGRSYYASSGQEMEQVVARNGGETASIDVGCVQINLRWHAGRFKNWRSLLDPVFNTEYAALYLTELYRETGSWSSAVGAYHSRTPWRSSNYACLVSRHWSQIFGSIRPGCGASIDHMARLMYQAQPG